MHLIFTRRQSRSQWTHRVFFNLFAKLELDEEEKALVRKYNFHDAALIDVPQPGLWRDAFFVGFFVALVFLIFFMFNLHYSLDVRVRMGFPLKLTVSLLFGLVVGFLFYQNKRETIYVKDLMHGRFFRCRSVVALVRKEAYLEAITAYFRQVLEGAKNWGGEEIHEIKPLDPAAVRNKLLSGPVF